MTQLYTNELVSIEKKIDSTVAISSNCPDFDLSCLYEVDRCQQWIEEKKLKNVCLQFPDYLLPVASAVTKLFEERMNQQFSVLADTSYESCCVDYVAAAHIEADGLIHFGATCFSKPSEVIPTLIVHEKTKFDLDSLFNAVVVKFQQRGKLFVVVDTPFLYNLEHIALLKDLSTEIDVIAIDELEKVEDKLKNGRILYLGDNNRKLTLFSLTYKPKELLYYNNAQPNIVQDCAIDERLTKRRSYLFEVIKDSRTVGIVVGTVAIQNYKVILQRVVKLCTIHRKKYYLISVGKPTVAKLANYPELDVYVLIGCPMSNVFESRDFFKPIVTAYDVEIALNPNSDTNAVCYHDLRTLAQDNEDVNNIQLKNDEISDVSLINGKLRRLEIETNENEEGGNVVALKGDSRVDLPVNGVEFLKLRSWKGLEQNLGMSEVSLAMEGRKGTSQSYESEPKH